MTRIEALLCHLNKGINLLQNPAVLPGQTWFSRWDYERMLGNLHINCPLDGFDTTAMKLENVTEMEQDNIWLVDFHFHEPQRHIKELICLYVKPQYGIHVVELAAWSEDGRLHIANLFARPAWESYESIRVLASRLCTGKEDDHGQQTINS